MTQPDQPARDADPDYDAIENVFRMVNREIWIVTASGSRGRGGLVATWVSQASLDRQMPVVVAGIAPNHFTAELIRDSRSMGLHLIGKQQLDLAWRFCTESGRDVDKLKGLKLRAATTGVPLLADCIAWLDCRVVADYDAGDRIFFWADVVDGCRNVEDPPLREQDLFASASATQLRQLRGNLEHDIAQQRPLLQKWRKTTHQRT